MTDLFLWSQKYTMSTGSVKTAFSQGMAVATSLGLRQKPLFTLFCRLRRQKRVKKIFFGVCGPRLWRRCNRHVSQGCVVRFCIVCCARRRRTWQLRVPPGGSGRMPAAQPYTKNPAPIGMGAGQELRDSCRLLLCKCGYCRYPINHPEARNKANNTGTQCPG